MPGLIRGVARTAVIAGTASSVAGRVNRRQQNKWAAQDQQASDAQQYQQQQQQPPQQQYAPAPPAPSTDDNLAQLQKLGELHAQGILTDEEFAREKTKLLG
jgi:Short C-terminal domain